VFTSTAGGPFQPSGRSRLAVPGFAGDVRVATGDCNGDGVQDTVMVTGPGTKTVMAVVNGKDGSVLVQPTGPFGDANFTVRGFVRRRRHSTTTAAAEWVITLRTAGGPRVVIFHLLPDGKLRHHVAGGSRRWWRTSSASATRASATATGRPWAT